MLQRIVPGLRCAVEVVRSEPGMIRSQGALAAEELLAVIQPIKRTHPVVIRRELELVEFGGRLGGRCVVLGRKSSRDAATPEGRGCPSVRSAPVEEASINTAVENAEGGRWWSAAIGNAEAGAAEWPDVGVSDVAIM